MVTVSIAQPNAIEDMNVYDCFVILVIQNTLYFKLQIYYTTLMYHFVCSISEKVFETSRLLCYFEGASKQRQDFLKCSGHF
jgi:hypothetical protein